MKDASPRSALAALTVPSATLAKDPLLALVAAIAPPYQTTVTIPKKGGALSLTVGPDTLTHRNAILRSLCGMGLHNALDTLGSTPLLFLGGHAAPSFAGASPASALAMAGISSWMSVAATIRDGGAEEAATLLEQLDGYLASRSFLVPSAAPTLADLDVYLAIVAKVQGEALEGTAGGRANARRWLEQCGATVEELAAAAARNAEFHSLPVASIPKGLEPKARPLPLFFYGDEDESVVAAAASAVASATKSAPAGKKAGGKPAAAGRPTEEQKKKALEKKAAKEAKKAAKPKPAKGAGKRPPAEPTIAALDIRVGKIVKAWEHESSEKLFCEEVDVGEEVPRKIASGLRAFYKVDEMQNRDVLVLCNLKEAKMGGFPSHGMVLCASNADHTQVEFAVPPAGAKVGERVTFEGYEGDPEPANKVSKKKIFVKLAPDLKTDGNGEVVWKGAKGTASTGVCKAVNGMANAQVA